MPIDYNLYHPKWSLISYLVRIRRANNCCEWCDAKHGESHPITGSKVFLSVAHINQDRRLNQFWNLAALCQRCHLSHDRKQHIFNRKYGRLTKYVCGKLFEVPYLINVKEYRRNQYINDLSQSIIDRKRRSGLIINNPRLFNTEISLKKTAA
jgi:hypothetical protein